MSVQLGQLIPGSLPDPNCFPASAQAYYNLMFSLGSVQFPGLTGVIISDTQPTAADRDKLWIKTSGTAPLWPLGYVYFNAQWVARHPNAPGDGTVRIYKGLLVDLTTYDGGDASAAGPASGPMWKVDPDSAAKFILSAGSLPSGKVLNIGDTGGEELHVLTTDELPSHTHPPLTTTASGFIVDVPSGGAGTNVGGTLEKVDGTTGATGGGTGHNTLPLYIVYANIIRTSRLYYRGT